MYEVINEKVGAWLLKEGNTRDVLAQALGITRPTLAARLAGDTKWYWGEVVLLARFLGVSLDELAGVDTK